MPETYLFPSGNSGNKSFLRRLMRQLIFLLNFIRALQLHTIINNQMSLEYRWGHRKHWFSTYQYHLHFMVKSFWTASWRTGCTNAITYVSSRGRAWIHAERSTVSQIGNRMIPLYGFSGLAGRIQDYKCDCSLCGGNQDNWTALSETQKMVKAIILKAQCEAELSATRQPFQ